MTAIVRTGAGGFAAEPRQATASAPDGLMIATADSPDTTASTPSPVLEPNSRNGQWASSAAPCVRSSTFAWRIGWSFMATSSQAISSMTRERMATGLGETGFDIGGAFGISGRTAKDIPCKPERKSALRACDQLLDPRPVLAAIAAGVVVVG